MLSTIFAATTVNLQVADAPNFGIEQLISWAVMAILVVAGLIFFFMLVLGGLKWILSGGDKASTEAARGQITAALIGLIIVFSAWAIASLVQTVFDVKILNFTIPTIGTQPGGGSGGTGFGPGN